MLHMRPVCCCKLTRFPRRERDVERVQQWCGLGRNMSDQLPPGSRRGSNGVRIEGRQDSAVAGVV